MTMLLAPSKAVLATGEKEHGEEDGHPDRRSKSQRRRDEADGEAHPESTNAEAAPSDAQPAQAQPPKAQPAEAQPAEA
jgi:hypothetical protein